MSTIIQNLDIEVLSKPGKTFTWLHISDTHFGHGKGTRHRVDQKMVTREILNDCKEMFENVGPPDAVFFTGMLLSEEIIRGSTFRRLSG